MSVQKKDKIIWAVNPEQDPKQSIEIVKELKVWAKNLDCEVQPVAVFSKLYVNLPANLNTLWKSSFEDFAQANVKNYLKKLPTKGFLSPELLFVPTFSSRQMAKEMAKYAEKNNALMLFANTRAKKTWNPFNLGGFAETLIATSKVPVLLLNPKAKSQPEKKSMLFPVDFTHDSNIALARIEPWVEAFNSQLLIYNQVETSQFYATEYSILPELESFIKTEVVNRNKKMQAWAKHLEKQNIKSKVIVHRQQDYLANEILAIAKKSKVQLIVLTSNSGPYYQAILGSVPRDVLLQASCPVLFFHRPEVNKKRTTNTIKANQNESIDLNRILI